MLGKIKEIIDNTVTIELSININEQPNLINIHVVFESDDKKIVAEIANVTQTEMTTTIVGQIIGDKFVSGASAKPSFKSTVRLINKEELELIFGSQDCPFGYVNFGTSNVYQGYRINVGLNNFFNSHFCIIGNSGSGKSCTVASILQKLYSTGEKPPTRASFFFFDAYGEYDHAFANLNNVNPKLSYKSYTTNIVDPNTDILKIPIWLLDVDDLALLLDATTPAQLPIIEKALKLVPILTGNSENVIRRKNDIIARALQDILLSGDDSTKIRDQVMGVLTRFNTPTLRLDTQIVQPGYTRTLKQCLYVDKTGKMQEMELVVEFIRTYILEETLEIPPEELNRFYSLADLEMAMDFSLISEGILKSNKVYDYANIISVRLHTLATGDNRYYFDYPKYVTKEEYINDLITNQNTSQRAQIVNFNINYIDDRMAKVMTKIISRMLFSKASNTKPRGAQAYHIVIEEAHRYVQKDSDIDLLGYNIFERISKEGRKYGVFLALVTQRPSELSDTCVSQCANFLILRTLHPLDLKYIKEMVPNVSQEIVSHLKNLNSGDCIAFGNAFKVPTILHVTMPNPLPLSNNVDLQKVWYEVEGQSIQNVTAPTAVQTNAPAAGTSEVAAMMMQQASTQHFIEQPTVEVTSSPQVSTPTMPAGVQVVGNGTSQTIGQTLNEPELLTEGVPNRQNQNISSTNTEMPTQNSIISQIMPIVQ